MILRSPRLHALSHVRHAFTDREGGVSEGPLASLNLALRAGESRANLAENWRRVVEAVEPTWGPDRVVLVDQVHGGEVVQASHPTGPLDTLAPADGIVSTEPGLLLAIRTADCVPVLLAGDGVVGAAHAGWRGVAAKVVVNTVEAMVALGARADSLVAVVGPHISAEAYEVGEEVVRGIAAAGVPESAFVRDGVRPHVDLRAAVTHQLASVGVEQVEHVARCTFDDSTLFSHRRDGPETGRQVALIGRVR